MSHFGKLLKEARHREGLTQKELADKVAVSDAYICKIERGVFRPPSREVVLKLLEVLGISDKTKRWLDFLLEAGVATKEDLEGFALVEVEDSAAAEEEAQASGTPLPTTANPSMDLSDILFGARAEEIERLVASGDYTAEEEKEVWAAVIELIKRMNALKAIQRATRKED